MTELKCPFCQQELEINDLDVQLLGCENQNCKHSIHYDTVGSKELWQSLINERQHATDCQDLFIEAIAQKLEIETELERTRKAFETAVDGLLAVWRATDCTTKQGSIAYNVLCNLNIKPLERIKALEQKDVK